MFKRLKEIRANMNLSQAEFAKSLGIGQSTLAMLEVGKRDILDRHIKTICSIYNVDEKWLRTGEGEMFVQSDTFSLDEKAKQHNLTELEIDIMRGYMELPADTRNNLMGLLGSIYNKHSETAISSEVDPIEEEIKRYRQELEAEQRGQTLLVSEDQKSYSIKDIKTKESS